MSTEVAFVLTLPLWLLVISLLLMIKKAIDNDSEKVIEKYRLIGGYIRRHSNAYTVGEDAVYYMNAYLEGKIDSKTVLREFDKMIRFFEREEESWKRRQSETPST